MLLSYELVEEEVGGPEVIAQRLKWERSAPLLDRQASKFRADVIGLGT